MASPRGQTEAAEQVQEQVDDIEIELHRPYDVVVDAEMLDDFVRVVDDHPAEDERADEREGDFPAGRDVWLERVDDRHDRRPQDEQQQRGEEKGAAKVKVEAA